MTTRAFTDTLPNALTSRGTNAKWWNGYGSGLSLTHISAAAPTIAFDVGASGDVYTGYLPDKASVVQPSPYFLYAGGSLRISLGGPANADVELKLEKWDGSAWQQVASSTTPTSSESITYAATSAYYRITVSSYSGAGTYTLTVQK